MNVIPTTRDQLLQPVHRWTALAKFSLCAGLQRGTVSIPEVTAAHNLSAEEIASWFDLHANHGLDGLRATRKYRSNAA